MSVYPSRRDFLKVPATAALINAVSRSVCASEKIRIAQVNFVTPNDGGWYSQHKLGVESVKWMLGDGAEITVMHSVDSTQKAIDTYRRLANEGHQLVFATSYSLHEATEKVAPEFPDIAWEQCAGTVTLDNLGTFEARYYEGMYLAGIAAASISKTGKLGFVGGLPVPDVIGPGNAFLLGAQSVNPAIVCQVFFLDSWFAPESERKASLALIKNGCDVLLGMTDTPVSVEVAQEKGVYAIGYASDLVEHGPDSLLTSVIVNWSQIYQEASLDLLNGEWSAKARWSGFGPGVIKMSKFHAVLAPQLQNYLKQQMDSIAFGSLQPYQGEILDNMGAVRVEAGKVMSDKDVRAMDWMVQGMTLLE